MSRSLLRPVERITRALLGTLALTATLVACAEEPEAHEPEFPVSVEAANGVVVVPESPARIVSLSPTATETLFEIGAGAQVVAVDDLSTYPSGAPRTSLSGAAPDVASILGYQPDLVVATADTAGLVRELNAASVPVLVQTPARSFDDVYGQMIDLGTATGNRHHALEMVDEMRSEIRFAVAETAERLGEGARPKVYHEVDETLRAAGGASLFGEIYRLFALRNIADTALGDPDTPRLTNDFVISASPEVIFLADVECCGQSAGTVAQRPGWNTIEALRSGSVHQLDGEIASRWGPRLVELVEEIGIELRNDHDRQMLSRIAS